MAKFQFRILTGIDEAACRAKYDAISPKNQFTFYLFDKGGYGYLGETLCFGGDAGKFNLVNTNIASTGLKPNMFYFVTSVSNITITDSNNDVHTAIPGSIWITNNNSIPSEISWTSFTTYMARYIVQHAIHADDVDNTYTGNETSIMTSSAILSLITREINAQAILKIQFFRDIKLVQLSSADIASSNPHVVTFTVNGHTYTAPISQDDHENDIGLVFQVQVGDTYDESENDGDSWIFVNLHGLIDIHVGSITNTTTTTVTDDLNNPHTKKIEVEVHKSTETRANFISNIHAAINSISDGNTYNPTAANGNNYSNNKFITESQLAEILAYLLTNFVQYNADEIIIEVPPTMEEEDGEL